MRKKEFAVLFCSILLIVMSIGGGLILFLKDKNKSTEEQITVQDSELHVTKKKSDKDSLEKGSDLRVSEKQVTEPPVTEKQINKDGIERNDNEETKAIDKAPSVDKGALNVQEKSYEETPKSYIYTNDGNAITPNETITIYDEEGRAIGQLIEGQTYLFEHEAPNRYEIQVENHRGYIDKLKVKEIMIDVAGQKEKPTNDFIQIKGHTKLYDSVNNELYYITDVNRRYPLVRSDASHYYVLIANQLAKVEKKYAEMDKGIAVLMYHHLLRDEENKNYRNTSTTISAKAFEDQIKYMYDHQFETVTPRDLELYLQGQKNLSTKAVVITFDDGLKSNKLYAYPILKKYNFKATNFIITSRTLDHPTEFNPDKLQFFSKGELKETADVFNFEGHTHELHAVENKISKVVSNTADGLKADFALSKTILPNQTYFAYPFGQYNQTTIRALKESGYRMAFTTKTGKVQKGDALFELNRIGITPSTTIKEFGHYLTNQF